MSDRSSLFFDTRVLAGIAIIAIGILLLFDNLGANININFWQFWPLILIIIGIGQLSRPAEIRQTSSGWILIILGVIFLLNSLDVWDIDFRYIWPILLILIGFAILRHSMRGEAGRASGEDYINLSFILGGGEFKFHSKDLKGGKLTAVMGGGKIDLTETDFRENAILIDAFAFWGGIDIIVPSSWKVNMKGTPIMGGMENKTGRSGLESTTGQGAAEKTLVVSGTAIMGGIEVKNR
jgi:hypothetical protein